MIEQQQKTFNKTTKVSLVVYCLFMLACFCSFIITSLVTKDYSYLYAFLLCLGPSILFVFVSLLFPATRLVQAKVGKGVIALYIVGYVLKYAAVIGIPFFGIYNPDNFNKWVMLGTSLTGPLAVIISKLIIANYVSKSAKKEQK